MSRPRSTSSGTDASFDIVTPIRDLCAEAELLELMDKVIAECQGAKGASTHVEYEFHVSHETGELNVRTKLTSSASYNPRGNTCTASSTRAESI